MDRGFRPRGIAPVKVGEELDVKIEAVGEKGDGIAKKSGFVLFVPGVKEGDEVRIRVTKVLRKVGFAEVIGEAKGPVAEEKPAKKSKKEPAAEETAKEAGEEQAEEPAEKETEPVEDTENF